MTRSDRPVAQLSRRGAASGLVMAIGGAVALPLLARGQSLDVPYVPTPQPVVDRMLALAEVRPGDMLIDLGSGDGRIPVTAASRYGIEAFGVDLNPQRVSEARSNARRAGVEDKARFEVRNLFDTEIARASVLTLYLLPGVNLELRPRILSEMAPGSRIVSHEFDMGDWRPQQTETIGSRRVHLWIVPARVEGRWAVRRTDEPDVDLTVTQNADKLSGSASIAGRSARLISAKVSGANVEIELDHEGRTMRLEGRVVDNRIEGNGWQAERVS